MLDNVAWLMEQAEVQHPSSSARTLAWAASGGQRGVIGSGSLAVVAQNVPDNTVQVRAGGAVIPSNYPGSAYESYIAKNRSATNVNITPTGSSGKRSDALVLRIDDTGKAGQTPSDIQAYDYVKLQVIQNVSASLTDSDALNLAYPSILLARIDIPASTGTITNAMIKDMRHIALAREESVVYVRPIISNDPATSLALTSTALYPLGERWTNSGGQDNNGIFYVDVPKYATRMQISADWLSVVIPAKSGWGGYWVSFGPNAAAETPKYYTQSFAWDAAENASQYRTNLLLKDDVYVPPEMRGTRQPFVMRGNRAVGSNTSNFPGRIKLDANSGVALNIRFLERPDTDLQAD